MRLLSLDVDTPGAVVVHLWGSSVVSQQLLNISDHGDRRIRHWQGVVSSARSASRPATSSRTATRRRSGRGPRTCKGFVSSWREGRCGSTSARAASRAEKWCARSDFVGRAPSKRVIDRKRERAPGRARGAPPIPEKRKPRRRGAFVAHRWKPHPRPAGKLPHKLADPQDIAPIALGHDYLDPVGGGELPPPRVQREELVDLRPDDDPYGLVATERGRELLSPSLVVEEVEGERVPARPGRRHQSAQERERPPPAAPNHDARSAEGRHSSTPPVGREKLPRNPVRSFRSTYPVSGGHQPCP